jgi:hypothetical protein
VSRKKKVRKNVKNKKTKRVSVFFTFDFVVDFAIFTHFGGHCAAKRGKKTHTKMNE